MFKRLYKFVIINIFIILLFFNESCYAAGQYIVWNNVISSVNSNKIWTIIFNKDVDIESAKNSIKIYEQGINIPLKVNILNGSSNTLQISPIDSYTAGKEYELVVDSSLKSVYNNQLKEGVKYNFTVDRNIHQSTIDIANYSQYYDVIKSALDNYEDNLVLNISNYDKDTYSLDVINKILIDYPNLRSRYSGALSNIEHGIPTKVTINLKYTDTKENLINKEKAIKEKVSEIISTLITSDMKDYEKELVLHDYVVNNTRYDERLNTEDIPQDSYTAYGVLINGVGVCQGYADAIDRLLNAAGVECRMVIGDAYNGTKWVGHAWNIVKIQEQYYNLDSTWDDPITNDNSNRLYHSYFNVTDDELSKNHRWNAQDYPKCDSEDYSFHNLNITEKNGYGNK